MNKLYLKIKDLAAQRKVSLAKVERDLGFSNGIISTWKKGKASQDKIEALADYFDVTTDYLMGRTNTPQFTRRDELDVRKTLEEMTECLNNKSSLTYMKNGGEEIDPEDAELLKASLEGVIRQSKLLAKRKFTPKKYRKDQD